MRRWWTDAAAAADLVAGRADLWLSGALAWTLTVGWIPLVAAVARPPTVADLTFLGARVYTSGAWPWNAVAAGAGALLLATSILVLVAVAEVVLVAGSRRLRVGLVLRAAGIGLATAAPAVAAALAGAAMFVVVAIRDFNAPGIGDPLLQALLRVAPFVVVVVIAWAVGSVAHAAALRAAVVERAGAVAALGGIPSRLRRTGVATVVAGVGSTVTRALYLAVASVLLSVLWDPIEARLAVGGIGAAVAPLLVGFVAIWLCILLGGGALHAWVSVTWTRVLTGRWAEADGAGRRPQGDPYRP